jgi:hypothetical protein
VIRRTSGVGVGADAEVKGDLANSGGDLRLRRGEQWRGGFLRRTLRLAELRTRMNEPNLVVDEDSLDPLGIEGQEGQIFVILRPGFGCSGAPSLSLRQGL